MPREGEEIKNTLLLFYHQRVTSWAAHTEPRLPPYQFESSPSYLGVILYVAIHNNIKIYSHRQIQYVNILVCISKKLFER